jgi:cerevisin
MATPHIVGLLAYLLSVYGTPEFYEGQSASVFADAAASRSPLASVLNSLPLPSFATNFLGFLFGVQTEMSFVAPIPKTPIGSVIAPSDLKKALQKLATKDVLSDMTGTSE